MCRFGVACGVAWVVSSTHELVTSKTSSEGVCMHAWVFSMCNEHTPAVSVWGSMRSGVGSAVHRRNRNVEDVFLWTLCWLQTFIPLAEILEKSAHYSWYLVTITTKLTFESGVRPVSNKHFFADLGSWSCVTRLIYDASILQKSRVCLDATHSVWHESLFKHVTNEHDSLFIKARCWRHIIHM